MAASLPYRKAKLSNTDPNDWFVFFYYIDPATSKYKRFKERGNLNNRRYLIELSQRYGKSIDDCRVVVAEEIIKTIDEELQAGFNPFSQEQIVDGSATEQLLPLLESLRDNFCIGATQSKKETYRLMFSRFKKYADAKEVGAWPPAAFTLEQAEDFQHYMQKEMKLAKKTVNATISHMGTYWDAMKKKVTGNPFRQVKPLTDSNYRGMADDDEDIYEPLTSHELDLILHELRSQGKEGFITFLAFIYYAWMRPVEITRLKISNIDLTAGVIRTKRSDTKNKKGGMVQIVPQLLDLLKQMELHKISRMDYFLFSKDFKPGPSQLDASRGVGYHHWNPVVEKLGIRKKMYALKHSGNIEYLLKNKGKIDLKWQQLQNRHSSAAQTEKYNRKLGAYFIDVGAIKFRSFQ